MIVRQDPGSRLEHGLVWEIRPGSEGRIGRQPGLVGQNVASYIADRFQSEFCTMWIEYIFPLKVPALRILFP